MADVLRVALDEGLAVFVDLRARALGMTPAAYVERLVRRDALTGDVAEAELGRDVARARHERLER